MLWLSCEGQIDVWELFSDTSHLSALLFDRQGLMVAAPVDMRTKKAGSFSRQALQGFLVKDEKKESQGSCDVTDGFSPKTHKTKGSDVATVPSVLGHSRVSNSRR